MSLKLTLVLSGLGRVVHFLALGDRTLEPLGHVEQQRLAIDWKLAFEQVPALSERSPRCLSVQPKSVLFSYFQCSL